MSESDRPVVILLSRDLLFPSSMAPAIARAGAVMRSRSNLAEALQQLNDAETAAIVVDLEYPGLNPADVTVAARASGSSPAVIGYAPHVKEALFAAAEQAGFNSLLSRGQVATQLEQRLAPAIALRKSPRGEA